MYSPQKSWNSGSVPGESLLLNCPPKKSSAKKILYLREEKLLIVENICFFPALCASLFDLLTFFGLGKAWL